MSDVKKLPVRKKPQIEGRFLIAPTPPACYHMKSFIVDETLDHVTCVECKEKLNPMHVLRLLLNQESQWHQTRLRYHEEMARLNERSSTKCLHCGKMTRISRS